MYTISPAEQAESGLFFRLDGEAAERHGAIGYLRGHYGRGGQEFHSSWFDNQRHLKSPAFKAGFDEVINSLRDGILKDRREMEAYCSQNDSVFVMDGGAQRGAGFKVQTQDYTYYARCTPSSADYDFYVFAYDNRYLLPELAGQHKLPDKCFSLKPSTGEVIMIDFGAMGYTPFASDVAAHERREEIDNLNAGLGVTRAQEEAMLAGSLFGFNTPGAKPWNYDQDGNPRLSAPKKDRPER
ncbi:MAG: hypothetical protein LBI19_01625 [Oscillospiraceae bacterium]|jgi:hypothetical protein|nr:hypothetical protein [Oscillospiraceae bacterium]